MYYLQHRWTCPTERLKDASKSSASLRQQIHFSHLSSMEETDFSMSWKSLENKPCNTLETLGRALFSTSPWHYQISCPKPHKTSELCMWGGGWGGGRRGFSMTWGSLRAPQQAASNTRDKTRLWWIHQLYIGHVWDAVTIWRRLHRFPSIFQHQSGQTWLSGFMDFF